MLLQKIVNPRRYLPVSFYNYKLPIRVPPISFEMRLGTGFQIQSAILYLHLNVFSAKKCADAIIRRIAKVYNKIGPLLFTILICLSPRYLRQEFKTDLFVKGEDFASAGIGIYSKVGKILRSINVINVPRVFLYLRDHSIYQESQIVLRIPCQSVFYNNCTLLSDKVCRLTCFTIMTVCIQPRIFRNDCAK